MHGNWPENLNLIENKLTKNISVSGERLVKVSSDGKNSITKFKLLEKNNFFSKLSCNLVTGRTHQIRVHTSYSDFPIVGDHKYGDRHKDKKFLHHDLKRMYLHSKSLEIKELNLKVISNEPKEFKKLIKINKN